MYDTTNKQQKEIPQRYAGDAEAGNIAKIKGSQIVNRHQKEDKQVNAGLLGQPADEANNYL